jgi:hypothetical protein
VDDEDDAVPPELALELVLVATQPMMPLMRMSVVPAGQPPLPLDAPAPPVAPTSGELEDAAQAAVKTTAPTIARLVFRIGFAC